MTFLIQNTENQKQTTKRYKYILIKTLFNFIRNSTDSNFINPCDAPILKKTFRVPAHGLCFSLVPETIIKPPQLAAGRSDQQIKSVSIGELILFGRCFGILDFSVCKGHDGILAQSSPLAIAGFEGGMTVFFAKKGVKKSIYRQNNRQKSWLSINFIEWK